MSWVAVAVAGATLVSGAMSSRAQGKAGAQAAGAQVQAAQLDVDERRRQFDLVQELFQPFIQAGTDSLQQQQALTGLLGPDEQRRAIQLLESSPMFTELAKQGETALLQNASATGGLRGGNIQAALAQYRPQLLNQQIQQQFANLAGLTQVGQSSAAGVGTGAIQTGAGIGSAYQNMGAAIAGGALARGQASANMWGTIPETIGVYRAAGGTFGNESPSKNNPETF